MKRQEITSCTDPFIHPIIHSINHTGNHFPCPPPPALSGTTLALTLSALATLVLFQVPADTMVLLPQAFAHVIPFPWNTLLSLPGPVSSYSLFCFSQERFPSPASVASGYSTLSTSWTLLPQNLPVSNFPVLLFTYFLLKDGVITACLTS